MDSSAAVLVVFGVIGYLILRHFCHRTHFRWETIEWQQNVFESTGFGLLLFGLARLLGPRVHDLIDCYPATSQLQGYILSRLPFPFPGSLILGTAIGLAVAGIVNLLWPKDAALARVVEDHGGRMRILLHEAHRNKKPVMISLNNRKMYVGAVFVPPPLRDPSHVVILPTISGFRDEHTLEVEWTTEYTEVYLEIVEAEEEQEKGEATEKGEQPGGDPSEEEQPTADLLDFQLVIPLSVIMSVTYFDFEVWERYFDPEAKTATTTEHGAPAQPAPSQTPPATPAA